MISTALFILFLSIELMYYLVFFTKLSLYKLSLPSTDQPPVSVIICARNESENLLNNLALIFDQDYPKFQVVIVDDCSLDDTFDILQAYQAKYSNIKVVTIKENERFTGGKKFAITMGIKAAQHELLLFTDADCKPLSRNWISTMVAQKREQTDIILGYSGYEKRKGFLNKLIRFDAFFIGIQYLSYALGKIPYMGVGRNMAYTKTLFFKNKGFSKHQNIPSGDDDLFVNQSATKLNTSIAFGISSQTISPTKETLAAWFTQKRRHITTGNKYKTQHLFLLNLFYFSKIFGVLFFITALVENSYWELVAGIFLLKLIIQFLVFFKPMKVMGENDLLIFSPLYDLILLFIYPFFVISNIIFKQSRWKRSLN